MRCGSTQCGNNTLQGLKEHQVNNTKLMAVYLNKHGANILFNHKSNPDDIIKFIKDNLELGIKTT